MKLNNLIPFRWVGGCLLVMAFGLAATHFMDHGQAEMKEAIHSTVSNVNEIDYVTDRQPPTVGPAGIDTKDTVTK